MANEGKSRRADGPGAHKPAAKPAARAAHHRGGMFNLDPEQQARLLLFAVVGLVVAIAAGFLVFGYWYSVIKPRHRTVLQVADQKVSYEAIKRRMAYEFIENPSYQNEQAFNVLAGLTVETLVRELTEITQAGAKLGITVDPDEALKDKLGIPNAADQRQFADALRKALDESGLSESQYRSLALAKAIDAKILEKFTAEAPATGLQAKIGLISAPTEADANGAILRIAAGEDFSVVAKAVSKEADVQTTGGIKEFSTKDALNAAYREFAFSAEIGTVSGAIPSAPDSSGGASASGLFYVVKVIDRSDQPLTDGEKAQVGTTKVSEWLKATHDEMVANGTYKEDFDQNARNTALNSIAENVGERLAAKKKKEQEDQQLQQDAQATVIAQLTAQPTADPNATAVPQTPAADATPAATPADQGSTGSPVAPAQPVAPGGDGQ